MGMASRVAKLGLLSGSFLSLYASSAMAEVEFCNNYEQTVSIAIAYKQDYSDNTSSYVARGWLSVNTGQCGVFDTTLHVPFFYYRGETNWFKVRGGRQKLAWGDDANKFITAAASFNYWSAEENTPISGVKTSFVGFTKSFVSATGDVSETVTFEADGVHTTQATTGGGNSNGPQPANP